MAILATPASLPCCRTLPSSGFGSSFLQLRQNHSFSSGLSGFPTSEWLQIVRRSPTSSGPAPPDFPTLLRPWFILSGPFTLSVLSLELLQNSSCGFSYMWSGARPSDDFELSSDTSPEHSCSGNSSSGPADFVSARLLDYMANHMPQCQPLT
ncbi:hypothetical protein R3P38DRAFT_3176076 [Favolaschia claudopus]|uniref:Uncharacterized protein n=1 Tax=Favolaschia claudopus TaxID=2862362 RepID=A0AAW0D6V0_9AGAR